MGAVATAKPQEKKSKVSAPVVTAVEDPQFQIAAGSPAGLPLFLDIRLQKKLAVGGADDPLEKEADRVADAVMRPADLGRNPPDKQVFGKIGVQRKCACEGSSSGQCEECRKREEELPGTPVIHRRTNGNANSADAIGAPPIVHQALRSPGRPLDASVRPLMESRFGRDFSDVRIHTGTLAAKSANAINALAYTAGSDVVFAEGQYSPAGQEGQHLLAHELTHTLQQSGDIHCQTANPSTQAADPNSSAGGGATTTSVPGTAQGLPTTASGNDPAIDTALQREIDAAIAGMKQDVDLLLRAQSARMALLLQYHSHPPLKEQADLDAFLAECWKLSQTELDTLLSFSPGGVELALATYPKGFPLTWSGRVQAALTLGADPATIVIDAYTRWTELAKSSVALAAGIYAHGLPVPFDDRGRLRDFHLRIPDGAGEKQSPVRDFARESIRYTQLKWLSAFAFAWETFVNHIAEAVADGKVVVQYGDWKEFVDNKQSILRDLPERARDRLATTEEQAQQMATDAVNLGNAALCVGMASAFISFFSGILSGWNDASALFDTALHSADKSVAGTGEGARIVIALQWAWDNDYFGGAAAAWAQNLIDNGPQILGEIALILILQMIPFVDVAVDIYLGLTAARDVLGLLAELKASFEDVMHAASVGRLQEGAARLAQVLTNGAILILIVLITAGIGKAAAKLRRRAAELRAADATLTEEAAEKQALKELTAEERKALEEGTAGEAAKIGKKFEEFEGACTLGSIRCGAQLPKHILEEAGEYPTDFDVPMPKGPFEVQSKFLSAAKRSPEFLKNLVRDNRKMFPEFDKALAAAEKQGKDWVYDSNGKAWEVHHIKPVFMGGESEIENLTPLPKSVHQKYSNFWNAAYRAFRKRFTDKEWGEIYTRSTKDVPGGSVPKAPK